jgi:probable HAF family extracellular repeat protein
MGQKRGLKDLGTLGGNYGEAFGINDTGDTVGWANTAGDATNHAVLWQNGRTTPTDLGVIAGYADSIAFAINSQGQIVGCSGCFQNGPAVLWENGDMVDLNTLVPPHPGVQLIGGDAYINDRGEIVTSGILSNGDNHAFLLTPCDEKHGDGEGCEEGGENAVPQTSPAVRSASSHTLPPSLLRGMSRHSFPSRAFVPSNLPAQ